MAARMNRRAEMRGFHVHVTWESGAKPWIVLIEAYSAEEARVLIEEDVSSSGGTVVAVEATEAA